MKLDSWRHYIGSVWGELLGAHGFDANASLIEIGPGFTDKIGLGLAAQGFRGTIYVVEPNAEARVWVAERYRTILPQAEVVPIAQPISTASALLPDAVEGLLMNHVLDDLILSAALAPVSRTRVFSAIRSGNGRLPEVIETWQRLFSEPRRLRDLRQRTLGEVERLIGATNPRVFGASQYRSWFLADNDLATVDDLGERLICDLRSRIGDMRQSDRSCLSRLGQDPRRWLICERPGYG